MIIIMQIFVHFFVGQFYTWSGFRDTRAVLRIVVEREDILLAIHSNLTVHMARLGDSFPLPLNPLNHDSHSSNSLILPFYSVQYSTRGALKWCRNTDLGCISIFADIE